MSTLDEVGEKAGWRCWLCDEAVDPDRSTNDGRGPSVDAVTSGRNNRGAKKVAQQRLAHRACNTRKGAVAAVVPWSPELMVADPAPIVAVVDRLTRKGGREVVGRCSSRADAETAGAWLLDRLSRYAPELALTTQVDGGGGQFLLTLRTA